MPTMAVRDRRLDRAARMSREISVRLGREQRDARLAAGLSQRDAATAAGMSHAQVGRIERGVLRSVSIDQICRLAAVLGLDPSVRLFPSGDPIRDAGQNRLLERLRIRIHSGLGWRAEVPFPNTGDLRAWDAVIRGEGWCLAVEAETRVADGQALERKLAIKRRDGGIDNVALLVADTRSNRAALAAIGPGLAADFPLGRRQILQPLAEGRDPGGSGIVMV
jgi:transcriptional regulator with XRE-family HTH domain